MVPESNQVPTVKIGSEPFDHFVRRHGEESRDDFVAAVKGPFLLIGSDSHNAMLLDLQGYEENEVGSLILGRDSRCDLVLQDDTVSRFHARMTYDNVCWSIMDLKSSNGTFVEERLNPIDSVEVKVGQNIRLGETLIVMFLDSESLYPLVFERYHNKQPIAEDILKPQPIEDRRRRTRRVPSLAPQPAPQIAAAGGEGSRQTRRRLLPTKLLAEQRTKPRSMARFIEEVQTMEHEQFLKIFPHPVLILLSAPSNLDGDMASQTIAVDKLSVSTKLSQMVFWVLAAVDEERGMLIGRSPNSDIVINHASISRAHAWIRELGGRWMLEDLGATNGSHVDGYAVDRQADLGEEALIRLGGECLLQFMKPEALWKFKRLFVEYPYLDF